MSISSFVPMTLALRANSLWTSMYERTVLRVVYWWACCTESVRTRPAYFERWKTLFREVTDAWEYAPRPMAKCAALFLGEERVDGLFVKARLALFWLRVSDEIRETDTADDRDEVIIGVLKALRDGVFQFAPRAPTPGDDKCVSLSLRGGGADDCWEYARIVVVVEQSCGGTRSHVRVAVPAETDTDSDAALNRPGSTFLPLRRVLMRCVLPAIVSLIGYLPSIRVASIPVAVGGGGGDHHQQRWWLCVDPGGVIDDADIMTRVVEPPPQPRVVVRTRGVMTRSQYAAAAAAAASVVAEPPPLYARSYTPRASACAHAGAAAAHIFWDVWRNRLFMRFTKGR